MIMINQKYSEMVQEEIKFLPVNWILLAAITSWLMLSFGHNAYSQNLDFEKIDSPDNSNFSFVTGITQAPNGLMWVATKNGLYSYNGHHITQYNPNPVNPNSLSSNALESIAIDSAGNIWIGTLGYGLDKFNPETGKFTHFRYNPEKPDGLSNDTVTKIICDPRGMIWIGTHGGLNKYIPETGRFEHYRSDPDDPASLSFNQVRALLIDSQGTLWVGTGSPYIDNGGGIEAGGLNRMDMSTGGFTRFVHIPGNSDGLMNNKISAIYEDRMGTMWIGTAMNGLHIFDQEKGTFQRQLYDDGMSREINGTQTSQEIQMHQHITFITEDIAGNLWLGTNDSGVLFAPFSSKQYSRIGRSQNSTGNFTDNGAWAAFTSRDGIFWLCGISGHLYRVNPLQKKISHFESSHSVQDFHKTPDGNLWVATDNKIAVKEASRNVLNQYKIDITSDNSDDDYVQKIMEDHTGNVWIGGNSGLSLWDAQKKQLISYKHEPENKKSLSNNNIITIYEDRKQKLWIGTVHGLNLMDKESGTFRSIYVNKADTSNIGLNVTTSILFDNSENLWIGCWNDVGIHLFDPIRNTSKQYLTGNSIICLFEDSFGTIWAGTRNGLFRYKTETDVFERFIELSSMNSFFEVRKILEDDQQNLWVSTDGIFNEKYILIGL